MLPGHMCLVLHCMKNSWGIIIIYLHYLIPWYTHVVRLRWKSRKICASTGRCRSPSLMGLDDISYANKPFFYNKEGLLRYPQNKTWYFCLWDFQVDSHHYATCTATPPHLVAFYDMQEGTVGLFLAPNPQGSQRITLYLQSWHGSAVRWHNPCALCCQRMFIIVPGSQLRISWEELHAETYI